MPADASPTIRLVDPIPLTALERRASDVHIEASEERVHVKLRVDGMLRPAMEPLDRRHLDTIVSRVKIMAELDIAEHRVPQDGRFKLKVRGRAPSKSSRSLQGPGNVLLRDDLAQWHGGPADLVLASFAPPSGRVGGMAGC